MLCFSSFVWVFVLLAHVQGYKLVKDYSGNSFFDEWDFLTGYDSSTHGDVVWLDRNNAYGQGLISINAAGNAILRVDNTHTVALNKKRNSVRIKTQASYDIGSLWIADMVHIPYGCSVWPAFWTEGPNWPRGGEIDILEGINMMDHNQMTLHTLPGCMHATHTNQTGISRELDCSKPSGCVVDETAPNSYQAGFAAAGGGVFATKFDVSGIFIWFWSRSNIPQSILEAQSASLPLDVSDWGPPSGSFPATTCDIRKFFGPQKLVLDITLCGHWAGQPKLYLRTCANSGPTNKCYNDNVVGPGAHYDDAYFEIKYVRAYTMEGGRDVTPAAAAAAVTIVSPNMTTTHTTIGLALSPRFYTGGAVGLHLGHTNGLGMLAVMVGAAVGCALYL